MKESLLDFSLAEIKERMTAAGQPAYRAGQVYKWLTAGVGFEGMTDLPKKLREALAERYETGIPEVVRTLVSSDGTRKLGLKLADGQIIETVIMQYKHGTSVCVSTQAGCRMGCRFCASTLNGLTRCLTAGEILGQVIAAGREAGERIDGVVLMGIGEPLDNYENVVKFLRLINAADGLNLGLRHISLSTCGLVPGILRLADEGLPVTLSISLHAADDKTRSSIMPVNNRYPIAELLDACRVYFEKTGRRISFEYTVITGVNDTAEDARRLGDTLRRSLPEIPLHVNLIPVNTVPERGFTADMDSVQRFCGMLTRQGINATVRRHLGGDIEASCGMLRKTSAGERQKGSL